ncbi:MAG: PilN domain-containing protein [Proteobacteria bacterium]|nr:PilN domain-containing protein [Pseudomonadota bacterium]
MSQQINLFNPAFQKQKTNFSLVTMLQLLGVVLAGSLLLYAYAAYQVSALDKLSGQSSRQLNEIQTKMANVSAGFSPQHTNEMLQSELVQLEKKSVETSQLVDALRSGVVGNTSGYSEYMRAFSRQVVPGLWLTGFRMTGDATEISLSGGVITPELVPNYIQKLGSETIMQGKNFSNLQMKPAKDSKYLEFTLYSTPADEVKP